MTHMEQLWSETHTQVCVREREEGSAFRRSAHAEIAFLAHAISRDEPQISSVFEEDGRRRLRGVDSHTVSRDKR